MSVRTIDRTEGKLQVLNCSLELAKYTLQICRNEKVFPKSQRWIMTSKIVNAALEATSCIREANAVYVSADPEFSDIEKRYRRQKQIEAHSHLGALYTLIDLAFVSFGIEAHRIEHWTGLVSQTDEKLKAWMKSDKEKYKKK